MTGTVEYRGVIQPLPSLTEPEQRELLKRFKIEEDHLYVLGRNASHDDLIRQQRGNRVLVTPHAFVLARQVGRKADRYASLLALKDEIHGRGGYIIEAATGKRSDRPADWRAMREEAERVLGRIAQGAKSAGIGRRTRGKVRYDHTDKDILNMLRIMDSKRYPNDQTRIDAIERIGVRPVPQRTWLLTKLKQVARERGLLD